MMIANSKGNQPLDINALNFHPLILPISNKNITKKLLKISFVNGLIPFACFAFANTPIIKLPVISSTLQFVSECLTTISLLI